MAHTSNLAGTSRTDYTGLRDDNPDVRVGCCMVLDHFMIEAALPELIENLAHPNPGVRAWAIHTLACDRCKQGVCRPGEGDTVPMAIRMLQQDASKGVRQMAAGMLGPSVHRSSEARDCSRKKVVVQRDNKACYRSRKSVARKKCGSNAGSEGIVNQEHDY